MQFVKKKSSNYKSPSAGYERNLEYNIQWDNSEMENSGGVHHRNAKCVSVPLKTQNST